jgi:hypothetical protein
MRSGWTARALFTVPPKYGITVIPMRFEFDPRKSEKLRKNPQRGIGFEEAQEIFSRPIAVLQLV